MQLHAVIVPPPGVVQGAVEAARDLFPAAPAAIEVPQPGLLDRLRGRRPAEPAPAPVVTLSPAASGATFVRLAKFGNVTQGDATDLAASLSAAASAWPAPVLRVSGVRVSDARPFDVTAQLVGDVDLLRDIFDNANEVARLNRFFLDRRSFRSELTLGSVEIEGGVEVPDSVAGMKAPHEGQRWSPSHITLLSTSYVAGGTTLTEVAQIVLAEPGQQWDARSGA